jgi:hypothetical protein
MKDFTTFFLASLAEVQLVIGKGENLSELQSRLSDHLRGVANAPKVLATYYEQWGIEVFQTSSRKSSPPRYEVELETQIAMAMQASIATASGQQHEVAGGPEDDAKLEAALQEEVDIFSDAIRHRLARSVLLYAYGYTILTTLQVEGDISAEAARGQALVERLYKSGAKVAEEDGN